MVGLRTGGEAGGFSQIETDVARQYRPRMAQVGLAASYVGVHVVTAADAAELAAEADMWLDAHIDHEVLAMDLVAAPGGEHRLLIVYRRQRRVRRS
jgi:hypothetical protein